MVQEYFGVWFPDGVFNDQGCPHEGKGKWDGLGAWVKSAHSFAILKKGQETRSVNLPAFCSWCCALCSLHMLSVCFCGLAPAPSSPDEFTLFAL